MKKSSKLTAMMLTGALVINMLPMTVFAAAGDPLTIATTIQGASITSVGTADATYAGATPGTVTLTEAQASGSTAMVVAGFDLANSSYEAYKVVAAKTGDVDEDDFGVTDHTAYTNGTLANGDWIVIGHDKTGASFSAADEYYIIAVTVTPAGGGGGTTVGGDSTVDNVVINVDLPTTLDFAIDPLDLDGAAGQVTAADFYAVNKTGVPVLVDVAVTAAPGSGVTIVDDTGTLDQELPDGRAIPKKAYFALLGAEAVADSKTIAFATDLDTNGPYFDFDETVSGTLSAFDGTSKKGGMQLLLDAATGGTTKLDTQTTLAGANKGVSAFTFYAELNTYADWQAGDLDVEGLYTLTALKASDVPTGIAGLNVLPPANADPSAIVAKRWASGTPLAVTIDLGRGDKEATAVDWTQSSVAYVLADGTAGTGLITTLAEVIEWDPDNNVLTFAASLHAALEPASRFDITLKFEDSTKVITKTVTLN